MVVTFKRLAYYAAAVKRQVITDAVCVHDKVFVLMYN